jgi:hypothetical protein
MKAYVILRKGFEYDDNIYSSIDGGGGTPYKIFFSQKEVNQKVIEMNIEEYKTESINMYSYDIEDCLNVEASEYFDFCKSLIEKYGPIEKKDRWSNVENILHPKADEIEARIYESMVNIAFFEWHETEIDIQSFRNQRINETLGE